MSSSLPENFSVRAATTEDAQTVTELLRVSEIAARGYSLAEEVVYAKRLEAR